MVVHAQTSDHDNGSLATQTNDGFIFQSPCGLNPQMQHGCVHRYSLKLSQHVHQQAEVNLLKHTVRIPAARHYTSRCSLAAP